MKNITITPQYLLEKYAPNQFPVPVISIAEAVGLSVFGDTEYDKNKDGHISFECGVTKIIVNSHKSASRKRFTIAHEIGHFFHDSEYLMQHGSIDRDGIELDETYKIREVKANDFAASLLMPKEKFFEIWNKVNHDIEKCADYFFVSKEAVGFRAINLGLTR